MQITVQKIADSIGGKVIGNAGAFIDRPSKIEEAEPGSITFIASEKYISFLNTSKASAYIVDKNFDCPSYPDKNFIQVEHVYGAIAQLLAIYNKNNQPSIGIAKSAIIAASAKIGKNVSIGENVVIADNAVIEDNVSILANSFVGASANIGTDSIIYSGVQIYHKCIIGKKCIIHANAVIGSDGFGFAPQKDGSYAKIPQVGITHIEDDVEIGAGCTIDRATMGETILRKGVKLDNLVHIAHNVDIGENTVIAAQVGIAGSTKIGKNCMIGGQSGIVGHLNIADETVFQAKSGMTKSVKEKGTKWYGYPAIEYSNYLRSFAIFKNLQKYVLRIKSLEEKIKNIERQD